MNTAKGVTMGAMDRFGVVPWLAALAVALPALLGCSSAPLPALDGWERGPARILRTLRGEGPLLAGAARVSLDPPFATPMGGYFGGSEFLLREARDPLFARAVVIEAGGVRLALVSIDRVLVPPELRAAVEARPEFQGAGISAWSVFATHCHTAPGAHSRSWAAQRFGLGTFDPLVFRHLAERAAQAVARAAESLRPVAIARGSAAPRSDEPPQSYNRKVMGAPADSTLRALGFWPLEGGMPARGAPAIEIVSFAAHPTMIPASLRRASADYPGVLCRARETSGAVALFAQGPSGDIAGGIHKEESRAWWERRLEWAGARLARLTGEALDGARRRAEPQAALAYAEGEALLPPRRPWRVPWIGRAIARNYPEKVLIRAMRIGDLAMVFFPGELGSDLGARICEETKAATGAKEAWLVTLADDYLGYVFSPEQYRHGGMSQHLTSYGEGMGELIRARAVEVARECRW